MANDAQVLLASATNHPEGPRRAQILGCVLGAVLTEPLLDAYRVREQGACAGDGLLAYIGLVPGAQRARVSVVNDEEAYAPAVAPTQLDERHAKSLASSMFSTWLEITPIKQAPRIFIRTRKVIAPVLHLLRKHNFVYRGSFDLQFHGECQDRLVFCKEKLGDR